MRFRRGTLGDCQFGKSWRNLVSEDSAVFRERVVIPSGGANNGFAALNGKFDAVALARTEREENAHV
jgi:hypothetical protein